MWQNTTSQDRLTQWRDLRTDIKELTTEEQIHRISQFFSTTPIGSRTLDYYTPESWPTPWEILHTGAFCTNSISLLIYYTFQLDEKFNDEVNLYLVEDESDRYLLPVINDHFVLNYELGAISKWLELKPQFRIIETFQDKHIYQVK